MRILLWRHQFLQIWWANQKHFKSLLEIRTATLERHFNVHGLLEDKPLSEPAIPSIKPQTPTPTTAKKKYQSSHSIPLTPSQPLDQQRRSIAAARTLKRTLFLDQPNTSASKKPRTEQTATTNAARIAAEFHNLVVPKIKPADKVPIAALKTKTQPKKNKDCVEDLRSQKK